MKANKTRYLLAALALFALAGCTSRKTALQRAADDGYMLGSSDAIKRQYWLKQAMEKKAAGDGRSETKTYYYSFDGAKETEDGRKLVDHTVTVPVRE